MRRLIVIAAIAGCENPSVIDDIRLPYPSRETYVWDTLAKLAAPIDRAHAHLAAVGDYKLPETIRIAELEAWAEAGGRLPPFDVTATVESGTGGIALTIAKQHPDDDRALQAALYLAQQLRRNETNLSRGMLAAGITIVLTKHRAHPPAFAARYAPTDDEVPHIFAGEAMWARTSPEVDRETADRLWGWLADAPRDRLGLSTAIAVRALRGDESAQMSQWYVARMYFAVDDYQRWLAR
jgi:hypothetical protein